MHQQQQTAEAAEAAVELKQHHTPAFITNTTT